MIPDSQARERPKSPKAHGYFLSNEVGRKKWLLPEQLTICEADRSGNLDRRILQKLWGGNLIGQCSRENGKRTIKAVDINSSLEKFCYKS